MGIATKCDAESVAQPGLQAQGGITPLSGEATAVSLVRAETELLERHLLNWVSTAKTKLDQINATGFPVMITLLVKFLSDRHMGAAC